MGLYQRMAGMAASLGHLYNLAFQLPEADTDHDYLGLLFVLRPDEWPGFGRFDVELRFIHPFSSTKSKKLTLSSRILEIRDDVLLVLDGYGWYCNGNRTPERLAGIVSSWKKDFHGSDGWGQKIVDALGVLHDALCCCSGTGVRI